MLLIYLCIGVTNVNMFRILQLDDSAAAIACDVIKTMKTSVRFKIFARFNEKKKKKIKIMKKKNKTRFYSLTDTKPYYDNACHQTPVRETVSHQLSGFGGSDTQEVEVVLRYRHAVPINPAGVEIVLVAARVLRTNEISNNNTENIIRFLCESSERKPKSYTL